MRPRTLNWLAAAVSTPPVQETPKPQRDSRLIYFDQDEEEKKEAEDFEDWPIYERRPAGDASQITSQGPKGKSVSSKFSLRLD